MKLWKHIKSKLLSYPTQKTEENREVLTFEQVSILAEQLAEQLKIFKCCGIICSSEMAASIALLACFAAEVTAVPLSARYGKTHCDKIIDTISPDGIIVDTGGELTVHNIKNSQYITPTEHPAIIMCTSGTTGKPKGVMLSEKNIMTNISDISEYFQMNTSDTILIARPLYHCAVLTGEFLTAIVCGANIRFYSERFNPTRMLELINEYKITAFCGTPTLLSIMARFNRGTAAQTLRHISVRSHTRCFLRTIICRKTYR